VNVAEGMSSVQNLQCTPDGAAAEISGAPTGRYYAQSVFMVHVGTDRGTPQYAAISQAPSALPNGSLEWLEDGTVLLRALGYKL